LVVLRGILVVAVAFVLGGLTSVGQQFLPEDLNSLANSAGSWTAICFAVLVASKFRGWRAATLGPLVFVALNEGYGLMTRLKGFPYGILFDNFWTLIALVAGPIVGLAAGWVRHRTGVLAAIGAAVPSAVLIGEGVYGLLYVSDTTSPVYWTGSIVVGAVFVVAFAILRLRAWSWGLVSIALTAIGAASFLFLYSGGLV
jgi:hypothetical protein